MLQLFGMLIINVLVRSNIESSDIYGTSCLLNLLIYLIYRHVLCGKCLKSLTIQYLRSALAE